MNGYGAKRCVSLSLMDAVPRDLVRPAYKNPPARDRFFEIDFLRVLAMLAVLVGHVTSTYIFQETHYQVCGITLAFFLNQGVRVSVPLFLVLSGFSLGIGKQPASYLSFVGGRFRRVLPYYVGWLLVYNLANAGFSVSAWWQQAAAPGWLLRTLAAGLGTPHLYFIQCYLLYPLLRRWMARAPFSCLTWSLAGTLLLQGSYVLRDLGVLPGTPPVFLWLAAPVWGFYFVAGMFLQTLPWEKLRAVARLAAPGMLAVCVLFLCLYSGMAHATGVLHAIKPELMAATVLVFLWGVGAWSWWGRVPGVPAVTAFLARHAMGIYYNHVLVIYYLRRFPRFALGMSGMALLFLATLALSIGVELGFSALRKGLLWGKKRWRARNS